MWLAILGNTLFLSITEIRRRNCIDIEIVTTHFSRAAILKYLHIDPVIIISPV
jgi:hypothetical protein